MKNRTARATISRGTAPRDIRSRLILANPATNEEADPDRRGAQSDDDVQDHNHAEMDRVHANLHRDGQQDRGEQDDGRGGLHQTPDDQQEHIDHEQNHIAVLADGKKRLVTMPVMFSAPSIQEVIMQVETIGMIAPSMIPISSRFSLSFLKVRVR